jgi:hypothetical protein
MKLSRFWKTDWFFTVVLFALFIGFMLLQYSNYPYFPSPPPNQYPQAFTAPAQAR